MPKRKNNRTPFSIAKHKIMGARLQLCYNFLQSFYGTLEKSYGRNSKQCKALWQAVNQLGEVKNQMDSQIVAENPPKNTLTPTEAYLQGQDLLDVYYCNSRMEQQNRTILDLATHKE